MSGPRPFHRVILALATVMLVTGLGPAGRPALGDDSADRSLARSLTHGNPDPVLRALADGRLVRSVDPPAVGTISLPAVRFGYGLTGDQLRALDVTATASAQEAVHQFVKRLDSRGIDASRTQWQVFTLPPVKEAMAVAAVSGVVDEEPLGSSLIVPAGTVVRFVGAVFQDGGLHVKTSVTATAASGAGHAGQPAFRAMSASPSSSVTFAPAGGVGCLERKQNSTAHYDPCQLFWQATNDNSSAREWFASEMHGTGKSHSVWRLHGVEVDSKRTKNTAAREWVDWDPGADAKGNCQDQTVGVSYAGASVSISKPHCELWDIDKGREALDMSNWWRGNAWREERSTAAVIAHHGEAG